MNLPFELQKILVNTKGAKNPVDFIGKLCWPWPCLLSSMNPESCHCTFTLVLIKFRTFTWRISGSEILKISIITSTIGGSKAKSPRSYRIIFYSHLYTFTLCLNIFRDIYVYYLHFAYNTLHDKIVLRGLLGILIDKHLMGVRYC